MPFFLRKAVEIALLPDALLVLLAAAGLWLGRRGRRRGRAAAAAGVGGLLACLLLPVDAWLLRPLEDRFPPPAMPARVDGIVVLGGSIDPVLSADRGVPSFPGAGERLTSFLALARRWPAARLVFTGGSGAPYAGSATEAEWARVLFADLGLPPGRVLFEDASRTTAENALLTDRLVRPRAGETWLLLTSAVHMPRAVGVFRHVGWEVVPWPVGYRSMRTDLSLRFLSLGSKLAGVDEAVHEWSGLLLYYLTGRTDALFPGPRPPGGGSAQAE